MLEAARQMGLEGIILKRGRRAVRPRGGPETWLKLKCQARQELIDLRLHRPLERARRGRQPAPRLPRGRRDPVRRQRRHRLEREDRAATCTRASCRSRSPSRCSTPRRSSPGAGRGAPAGGERWVEPKLVAEVSFAEWTPDGHVRQAVFQGLRLDTPASSVRRERPREVGVRGDGRRRVGAGRLAQACRRAGPRAASRSPTRSA
jgi:bifunctional non-homologous end joining protein LigD